LTWQSVPKQHFIVFCPRDTFYLFHIVECIKVLLRAVCVSKCAASRPTRRTYDTFYVVWCNWDGSTCNCRWPVQKVHEGPSEGAQNYSGVLLFLHNIHSCFTYCFIKVNISEFKQKAKYSLCAYQTHTVSFSDHKQKYFVIVTEHKIV
jgi:hypothetical protein